ncbi:MAG TPA: hypothetical protein VFQ85_01380 [Mycobacteriales bacterium]|jgi:hypothetical protein|nr:hypothetical protein [Mycobacteriales bacterium]
MVRTRVLALLATLAAAASALPAGAAAPLPAPSAYGVAKGFQLVGHTNLGKRGMNSPIAVAGSCVYVGDRSDKNGIAIVSVKDPRRPVQVGTIPKVTGATQRELRADAGLGILVVMSYSTSTGGPVNTLKTYDISNCAKPTLLSTVDFLRRSPHEFFLWKDPKHPGRALAYVTFTIFSPDLEVYDLSDPRNPTLAAVYDLGVDSAKPFGAFDSSGGYLHSLSVSDDGTRAYLGTWDWGLYVADTSSLAAGSPGAIVPLGAPLSYAGNVHGGVKVPGKPYAVLVQEGYAGVYPPTTDSGCPFGWLRMADLSNEALPTLTGGEFKLRENDCDRSKSLNGTFTSHNQTVFPDVALAPWYGGGLRAVDISNPKAPVEAGAFVPRPEFEPYARDTRLYFSNADRWIGAMWSYPVVQNGLIYVVDIDLGLYVLRYTGKHAKEVSQAAFVEGNSAPSRFTKKAPVIKGPKHTPGRPGYVLDRFANAPLPKALKPYGFLCTL